LRIPITSFPAGRTGSTASLALVYNSSIYAWDGEQLVNSDFISPGDSGGWHYSFDYNFTSDYIPFDNSNCNSSVNYAYYRYRLITPDGTSHVSSLADEAMIGMDTTDTRAITASPPLKRKQ